MPYTYKLSSTETIDIDMIISGGDWFTIVKKPRELDINGIALFLLDGQPDLPVGAIVKVWMNCWFRCETVNDIQS